jgi:hypothetical protein
MASTIGIKRRAVAGGAGVPSTLKSGELAYSEFSDIVYYGKGDNGSGVATSIIPFAGLGAFLDLASSQTVNGAKTFSSSPLVPTVAGSDNSTKAASTAFVQGLLGTLGNGDMLKSMYDTNNNGVVDNAEALGGNAAALYALLASPAFTGSPTAPTPATTANNTLLATTAFVKAYIASILGVALGAASLDAGGKVPSAQLPAYVDDVLEFANLAAFPGTGTAGVIYVALDTNKTYRWSGSAYVAIASGDVNTVFGRSGNVVAAANDYNSTQIANSSGVTGATVTAALNTINAVLATLGTMATQNASAVNITGGTIDGVTIDGGSF